MPEYTVTVSDLVVTASDANEAALKVETALDFVSGIVAFEVEADERPQS